MLLFVQALTIADLIRNNTLVTKVSVAGQTKWSDPARRITVIVPLDSANVTGVATVDRVIDYTNASAPYYQIVTSDQGVNFVYDNFTPKELLNPDIRFRTGLKEGRVADNGYLYVTNSGIGEMASLADVMTAQGCGQFLKEMQTLGILSSVQTTVNMTFFCPPDAGFPSSYSSLTNDQKTYVIKSHIVARLIPSTLLQPYFQTASGAQLTVKTQGDGATVGADGQFVLADSFYKYGVVHKISKLQIPTSLPSTSTNTTADSSGSIPLLPSLFLLFLLS
ncbi:hypothetical protein EDD86DRAFT_274169 [Gorgonomyces haynaldii]|nr:hypothetical protein EDD86DRAFT_274169 [Gorgonomyces haynaldii]